MQFQMTIGTSEVRKKAKTKTKLESENVTDEEGTGFDSICYGSSCFACIFFLAREKNGMKERRQSPS